MRGILVAVCGNNGIGKTTFSAALAAAVTRKAKKSIYNVLLIDADKKVPAFGCFAPNDNITADLGALMRQPRLTPEIISDNISCPPGLDTIGLMGYQSSAKYNDYSTPDEDTVRNLIMSLKLFHPDANTMTGAVIVDCGDPLTDPFSAVALDSADIVFCLLHGDRQGVLMYHSCDKYIKYFESNEIVYSIIPVARNTWDPVEEVSSKYFHTDFPALPRIDEAHRKMVEGKLFTPYDNNNYRTVLDRAAEEMLEASQYVE
jgi:cellulose biosynthesis protein BcsQ